MSTFEAKETSWDVEVGSRAQEAVRRVLTNELQKILYPHNKSSNIKRALHRRSDGEEVHASPAPARSVDLPRAKHIFPASALPLLEKSREERVSQ